MKEIIVIDYGVGNIRSVVRGIEMCGYYPKLTSNKNDIIDANKVILPGVGAFNDGMEGLRNRDLIKPICEFVNSGGLFLGICLGMQMMMTKSYEFGEFHGLNLIEGEVLPFSKLINKEKFKIPHIGWNNIECNSEKIWNQSILKNLENNSDVYFIHSYYVKPKYSKNNIATCNYGNLNFSAVIQNGNAYGCQFHPEKSGKNGLLILKTFCDKQA